MYSRYDVIVTKKTVEAAWLPRTETTTEKDEADALCKDNAHDA